MWRRQWIRNAGVVGCGGARGFERDAREEGNDKGPSARGAALARPSSRLLRMLLGRVRLR